MKPHPDNQICTSLSVAQGMARCWHINLTQIEEADFERFAQLLPRTEIERIERYGSALDRKRTVVAHGALRLLMNVITGIHPTDIAIHRTTWGKPRFATDEYTFNISHSGDKVLLVIARGGEVGIDVERIRVIPDLLETIRRFLHLKEVKDLMNLPQDSLSHAFFRLWVCKEAIAKAIGLGLALDMSTYRVTVPQKEPRLLEPPESWAGERWFLQTLPLPDGYAAAVAAPWDMKVVGCHYLPLRSLFMRMH